MKTKSYLITTIILAIVALTSSIILLLEEIHLWKNPNYIPSCSWNPLFSCTGPMSSLQAAVIVIPNVVIGIVAFTIVILIAFTSFFVNFPKWYWMLWTIIMGAGLLFVIWLITQTLYDIKALCVYCMIVWTCVIPLFWLTITEYLKTFYIDRNWVKRFVSLKWLYISVSYFIVLLMVYLQFTAFFNLMLRQL